MVRLGAAIDRHHTRVWQRALITGCAHTARYISSFLGCLAYAQCIELNSDFRTQYLKYVILIVFLVMASMRALQIGRLDPIVMMYRALTAFFTPASDLSIGQLDGAATTLRANQWLDALKFASGTENQIFVGSFWIALVFLLFVAINLWKPLFFCRVVCRLSALLGALASSEPIAHQAHC